MVLPPATNLDLFPTLVQMYDLNKEIDADAVSKRLKQIAKGSGEYGLFDNTHSSYPYDTRVADRPEFEYLRLVVQRCVNNYVEKAGFKKAIIGTSWFNIGHKGSTVKLHKHRGCSIAATYYPRFPPGSSALQLERPIVKDLPPPDFEQSVRQDNINQYNAWRHTLPIEQGHLYIFPAWMYHISDPNPTDERIMLGFNLQPADTSHLK